ncbi:MAG: T9SS type A sorting domain-containing protein [Calditrichaeota bacterium]|nr:T9SS type A sorting domain-containing protein [Calditrichota bacterium]
MRFLLAFLLIIAMFVLPAGAANNEGVLNGQTSTAPNISDGNVTPAHSPLRDNADDVEVFIEDFENGAEGWTTYDWTNLDTAWHKSDLLNPEDDNLAWWCGDTLAYEGDPVGYDNYWHQWLDTPVLNLAEAADGLILTFNAYWLLEDPRRVPGGLGNYDGWDGWFLQVSTNAGEDFEVVEPASPAYTSERLSAAGRIWGYGDVPAYVFESKIDGIDAWDAPADTTPEPEWVDVEFDLSAYRGEAEVVIRWVLVSDRTVAAPWNYYLGNSGVIVDNIVLQDDNEEVYLFNDADADPIPEDLIPISAPGFGDWWELSNEDQHSGETSMWHSAEHNNNVNTLDTPPFEIPEDINTLFTFWVYCDVDDSDGDNNQNLDDFYQIMLSDDDGATWAWQVTDYNRDETGGMEWTHYVAGMPYGEANIDLDLTEWAGETVMLRWMYRSDHNDDGGVGSGLWLDDLEVLGVNRQPRDAGMTDFNLSYPVTVNHRILDFTTDCNNFGTSAIDNIWAEWGWGNDNEGRVFPIIPRPSLEPEELIALNLTDFVDRQNLGWTPVTPGTFDVWTQTNVGSNTPNDPDDDDQFAENDRAGYENVTIQPAGVYELGFDGRSMVSAYNFEQNTGAAVRFRPVDIGMETYSIGAAKLMFNGVGEATMFTLHILGDGGDAGTPGAELFSTEVEVTPETSFPNWLTVPLYMNDELMNLQDMFWIWAEVTGEENEPQIVGDELVRGGNHFFNFDGENAAPYEQDLMIHAIIVPEIIEIPMMEVSTELVDFDEIFMGTTASREVRFYNTSFVPLTITSVATETEYYEADWPGETTLNFGESIAVEVMFTPPDDGFYQDALVIEANVENLPDIRLAGSGMLSAPGEDNAAPYTFGMANPYPNPFNSTTRIDFSLGKSGLAKVSVFDLAGRKVLDLAEGQYTVGNHSVILRADQIPTGLYLVRLESSQKTAVKKIALIK